MREAVTMRFPERLLRYQKQQMQNAADAGTSALIYGGDKVSRLSTKKEGFGCASKA